MPISLKGRVQIAGDVIQAKTTPITMGSEEGRIDIFNITQSSDSMLSDLSSVCDVAESIGTQQIGDEYDVINVQPPCQRDNHPSHSSWSPQVHR